VYQKSSEVNKQTNDQKSSEVNKQTNGQFTFMDKQ